MTFSVNGESFSKLSGHEELLKNRIITDSLAEVLVPMSQNFQGEC